jgi:glyoxylase-like metal-dependent hydrolase (beta-lactamase superfamily II)
MSTRATWTEPAAEPVAEGVFRIPLPLPNDALRAVNVYLIRTPDGPVCVDGGWALEESRRALDAALQCVGHEVGDITRFLVTHAHRDHYTQAVALRREFGALVSLGTGDRDAIEYFNSGKSVADSQYRRLLEAGAADLAERWRAESAGHSVETELWQEPDEWLDGDVEIAIGGRTLAALATPGHTRGHYVFADAADGLLFAGDHVLPTITPSIGFEPVPSPLPLSDFLGSLAKVRALPDMRLLPAHGPATTSTHQRIDELLAHHEERLRLCEDLVVGGCRTAAEVAAEIPWTRRGLALDGLDVFNAMLAVLETDAHLRLLAAQQRLDRCTDSTAPSYHVPNRHLDDPEER